MSVTFFCPQAPTVRRESFYEPGEFEDVSTLPEINLSNCNAAAMVDLMGLAHDCYAVEPAGLDAVIAMLEQAISVPIARISALEPDEVNGQVANAVPLDQLMANTGDEPSGDTQLAVKPQTLGELLRMRLELPKVKGPTVVRMGRTDGYIVSRASALKDLFLRAKAGGWAVCWG